MKMLKRKNPIALWALVASILLWITVLLQHFELIGRCNGWELIGAITVTGAIVGIAIAVYLWQLLRRKMVFHAQKKAGRKALNLPPSDEHTQENLISKRLLNFV